MKLGVVDYIVQILLWVAGAAGLIWGNGNLTLWAGLNLIAVNVMIRKG
jgi:hypothetical protein